MQKVFRLIFVSLLATGGPAKIWAMEDPNIAPVASAGKSSTAAKAPHVPAEYKRSDANFYPKAAFVKDHPTAVIIPYGGYTKTDDSYFFTPKIRAPKDIYFEVHNDWIEPITPPDMPASLGVAPDAMQIREPQGDVQIALPSAPASFSPVTDGMTLPNGAVLKTGDNGTAAVLFGGVDSARLMPDSAAAVQQTVTAQTRSAEVDLTAGGVFSKVGTQVGVKGEYAVHTPFGNAVAQGGDFVTITVSGRTDVWIAKGMISLEPPDSKEVETATSDGTGALKLIRFPGYADAHQALVADAETLTTTLDFIPLANQKLKALRDKMGNGIALTPNEQAYLGRIRQVPSLIKLALVEPPAPVIAPLATAPSLAPMQPMVQSPPATPSGPVVPVNIDLQADGSVAVNGISTDLASLKARLLDIAKANPTQPLVLTGRKNVTRDQLKKVIMICHEAKLKVKIAKAPPAPTAPPAAATNPPPSLPMPVAPKVEAPTISPPPPAIVSTSATNAAPMVAPAAPAKKPGPLRAVVRIDGKINFQGATFDLPGFKLKLEKIVEATPDQTIQLKVGKKVSYENFQAALEICHSIPVNHLAIIGTPPTPDSAFSSDAPPVTTNASSPAPTNLPTPSLRMNPYMEAPSTNIPSASPAAPPATNAPPMPGA